jgi:spore germination protein KB
MVVVVGGMTLICAFAVRGGVEVLGRIAQIIIPVVILSWLAVIILLIPELNIQNMLPIMENGIMPSIKGAKAPQVWFSLYFLISYLYPFLSDRVKGMKWGMISVFFSMFILTVLNFVALFLFGDFVASLSYPLMAASR